MPRPLFALAALTLSCAPIAGDPSPEPGDPPGAPAAPDAATSSGDAPPPLTCDRIDVLLVVDTAASMDDERALLNPRLPELTGALERATDHRGRPLDYHLGVAMGGVGKSWFEASPAGPVARSRVGPPGILWDGSTCEMPRRWLERGDPDLSFPLTCTVGRIDWLGELLRMPLDSARLALTARTLPGDWNEGFVRADAYLAMVLVTDADDCSRPDQGFTLGQGQTPCDAAAPVADYLARFDRLKGGRERWAAAVVAGGATQACRAGPSAAGPAPRLHDFAAQGGERFVARSLCDGDLTSALDALLAGFAAECE